MQNLNIEKMKYFVGVILFVLSYSLMSQSYELSEGTTLDEALAKAKKNKKVLLLDFYTDWCGYCKKMDASTFKDAAVVQTLEKGYYVLKVNAEKGHGPALRDRFNIRGYPSFVILDGNGEVKSKIAGFKPAIPFNEWILTYVPKNSLEVDSKKEQTERYIALKRNEFIDVETEYFNSLSFKERQELKLSKKMGNENNTFDFDELLFDVKDDYWKSVLSFEFKLGQGKIDSIAYELKLFPAINDRELSRYVQLMIVSEEPNEKHLLWINRLIKRSGDNRYKELKLYLLQALSCEDDAKQLVKHLKKAYKGQSLPESLKLLLAE